MPYGTLMPTQGPAGPVRKPALAKLGYRDPVLAGAGKIVMGGVGGGRGWQEECFWVEGGKAGEDRDQKAVRSVVAFKTYSNPTRLVAGPAHWASWICTSLIAGTDLRSPIFGQDEVLYGVKGNLLT